MEIQWSLVLFTALTGMSGMLFFFVCLNVLLGRATKGEFAGAIASIVLAVVGGIASATHLSHPDRMLNALQHPTSGIFTEAVLVGLLCVCAVVFAIMVKREIGGAGLKAVAVVGMVVGVLMSFMAGHSYIMASTPAWNTNLLPLGYLGTAAAEGAAAYLLLIAVCGETEPACKFYGNALLVAGVVSLVTTLAYGAVSGAFASSSAAVYVLGAVVCGGIAPAAFGAVAAKKPALAKTIAVFALVLVFVGACAYRVCMWTLGVNLYGFFGLI